MPAQATISAACYTTNMNNVSLTTTSLSGADHYQGRGKSLRVTNGPAKVKASDFTIGSKYNSRSCKVPAIAVRSASDGLPPVGIALEVGNMTSTLHPQSARQGSTVASRLRNTPRQAAVAGTARRVEAEAVVAVQEEEDGQLTPTPSNIQEQTAAAKAKTPEELENEIYGTPPPFSLDSNEDDSTSPAQDINTIYHEGLTLAEFLANSGVSAWTDYPLSTSPRPSMAAARTFLDQLSGDGSRNYTLDVGTSFPRPSRACHKDVGISEINDGHGFADADWDGERQPRMERAREEDGEDVAPKVKPVGLQMSRREREEAAQAAAQATEMNGPPQSQPSRFLRD